MPCSCTQARVLCRMNQSSNHAEHAASTYTQVHYSLMERMDGTVRQLILHSNGSLGYELASRLVSAVHEQLKCILQQSPHLMYFDLGPSNVAYQMVNGQPIFKLIDYGSFAKDARGQIVGSYPCLPNHQHRRCFVDGFVDGDQSPNSPEITAALHTNGMLFAAIGRTNPYHYAN